MDLKFLLSAISIKMKKRIKITKNLTSSYVSLFLVAVLLVGATTAWYTASSSVTINTGDLSMTGSTGMRNDRNQRIVNEIKIPAFTLEEASSVDGRTIYFPSSSPTNVSDNSSSAIDTVTDELCYREANVGDQNVRYAYAEAALTGSSDQTNVWIRSYKVEVGNEVYQDDLKVNSSYNAQEAVNDCPVRIAIISDSADDPKVFDPSALVKDYAIDSKSVYYINQEGSPRTKITDLDAFSSYYYGTGDPLFVLNADETKSISILAWLEGTHPRAKDFEGQQLSVEIQIETNVSDMEYVFFHDWTVGDEHTGVNTSNYKTASNTWTSGQDHTTLTGHWLSNDDVKIAMSYYDTTANTYKSADMTRMVQGRSYESYGTTYVANDPYTYMAAIPKAITTDISFYRLAKMRDHEDDPTYIKKGQIYNAWHTKVGINSRRNSTSTTWCNELYGNLKESRVINGTQYIHYHAIRGNGNGVVSHTATNREKLWLDPCVGYWGTADWPVR